MDIVVGVDGSPVAVPVLQAAVAEAKLRRAKLHLVHAVCDATWSTEKTFVPGNIIAWLMKHGGDQEVGLEQRTLPAGGDTVGSIARSGYPPMSWSTRQASMRPDRVGSRGFGD